MYWIKMLLFVFILINIKINDQGHCSDVTTALVEYDDVSDGNLDLPVTMHGVTDERVDRSVKKQEVTDGKANTPVKKHGIIDGEGDRLDKKFKGADVQKVAGSKSTTSNVTIVADVNAIGSVNNTIQLRNNVTNVETYGIFENDTITFTFNVADFDVHGDLHSLGYFKVDFGKDVAKFNVAEGSDNKILIEIKINNEKAEPFNLESNSFTTMITKDGKITVENEHERKIPSLKELKTIPTKDNQQAVRIKFDGSGLKNASVKLYFKTKVGKIFVEEPSNLQRFLHGAKIPAISIPFVVGTFILSLGIVLIICSAIDGCPIRSQLDKWLPRNGFCNEQRKLKKCRKPRKKCKVEDDAISHLTQDEDNQANSNYVQTQSNPNNQGPSPAANQNNAVQNPRQQEADTRQHQPAAPQRQQPGAPQHQQPAGPQQQQQPRQQQSTTPVEPRPQDLKPIFGERPVSIVRVVDGRATAANTLTIRIPMAMPVKEKKGLVSRIKSIIKTDKTQDLTTDEIFAIDDWLRVQYDEEQQRLKKLNERLDKCPDEGVKMYLREDIVQEEKRIDEIVTKIARLILDYWVVAFRNEERSMDSTEVKNSKMEEIKKIVVKTLDKTQDAT